MNDPWEGVVIINHDATHIAEQGEVPDTITMRPEDWVGTEDVIEFLRISEELNKSSANSQFLIKNVLTL